jgi:hypothetical protein
MDPHWKTAPGMVAQGPRFGPAVLPCLSRCGGECPGTPAPHSKRSADHRFCGPRLFRTERPESQLIANPLSLRHGRDADRKTSGLRYSATPLRCVHPRNAYIKRHVCSSPRAISFTFIDISLKWDNSLYFHHLIQSTFFAPLFSITHPELPAFCRGRDTGCPVPPARIRTGAH